MSYFMPDLSSIPSEKEKERRDALDAKIASEGCFVSYVFHEGVELDMPDLSDPLAEDYDRDAIPVIFGIGGDKGISEGDGRPTLKQVISEVTPAIKREIELAHKKWARAGKDDDFTVPAY